MNRSTRPTNSARTNPRASALPLRLVRRLAERARVPADRARLRSREHAGLELARTYRELAERHAGESRWTEAAAAWRQAMMLAPEDLSSCIGLARCLAREGRHDEALALYLHAHAAAPADDRVTMELGAQLVHARRFAEALDVLCPLREKDPSLAPAALGAALHGAGRHDEGMRVLQDAVASQPADGQAWGWLAAAFHDRGKHAEAVNAARKAIELGHGPSRVHEVLGAGLHATGQHVAALEALDAALRVVPSALMHAHRATTLFALQRHADAIEAARAALRLDAKCADALAALAQALGEEGKHGEAVEAWRKLIGHRPDDAGAYTRLAQQLYYRGSNVEALAACEDALRFRPDCHWTHNIRGLARLAMGDAAGAAESCRRGVEINSSYHIAHSNVIFSHLHEERATLESVKQAHLEWARLHAVAAAQRHGAWGNNRDPERPLVLGFVSPDLSRHPVGCFAVRVIEALKPRPCRTICYSGLRPRLHDARTERFKKAADAWREIEGMSDADVAAQIRADEVDVLFELSGHMAGNRLRMFTLKPAPIQVTWAGWMATTGLEAIDYILADPHEIPPEAEPHYTERVLRMPRHAFSCYDPMPDTPPVAPLPALARGHVTFGSFNRRSKMSPRTIAAWAQVLRRVPGSRLLIKFKDFNDQAMRDAFRGLIAAQGVDGRRIDFMGGTGQAEHLAAYRHVDIQLDTMPYTGSTTTMESLWMGVPVITLPGQTFPSRHSLSVLSVLGCPQWVAQDVDDYVDKAVEMAGDLARLAEARAELRARMAVSPLLDGEGFARDLLQLLRGAWRQWCAGAPR